MREASVILLGGHSIDDNELKYGLSVTGTVHPKKMLTNSGARVGDKLILTKPLGTGIINTALKAGLANEKTIDKVTKSMASLNKEASELMQKFEVHACTDITGFGFIGHTQQIAQNSQVGIKISSTSVPFFAEAKDFANKGMCPGGLQKNREFYSNMVKFATEIADHMKDILFDPQTSGGLLIALGKEAAKPLLDKLYKAGLRDSAIIGEVISKPSGRLLIE
jgi:selenide,water dikinase